MAKITAYFFLGSARIFLGFGSTKILLDSAQLFYGSAFAAPASAYRSTRMCLLPFWVRCPRGSPQIRNLPTSTWRVTHSFAFLRQHGCDGVLTAWHALRFNTLSTRPDGNGNASICVCDSCHVCWCRFWPSLAPNLTAWPRTISYRFWKLHETSCHRFP